MAFSNKEMAVISSLAYYNVDELNSINDEFSDVLIKYQADLKKDLGESYYDTIDNLIKKTENGDYIIVKAVNDKDDTGFAAFAVKDPNNEVTIACRGTEGFEVFTSEASRKDVWTDLQIGLAKETNQHKKMEQFMDELDSEGYAGYYFTGHSLGGNNATHGAVYLGDPHKVKGVVTFNSPGFNLYYCLTNSQNIDIIGDKIVNIQNEGDLVSSIEHVFGKIIIVESKNDGTFCHSLCNFKFNNKGKFVVSEGKTGLALGAYTLMPIEDSIWVVDIGRQEIYSKFTGADKVEFRDFSKNGYDYLIEQIKEVEEPQLFAVKSWDCWNEFEQAFGSEASDFLTLSNVVDKYIIRLADINKFSVDEIDRVFDKIYEIDNASVEKINTSVESLKTGVLDKLNLLNESIVPNT